MGRLDFSVGLIEFDDGVVARITNSIVAPYDHRFRVVGEYGAGDRRLGLRQPRARARCPATSRLARFAERRLGGLLASSWPPCAGANNRAARRRWISCAAWRNSAEAIAHERPSRLDGDFAAHVTEVTERLHTPSAFPTAAPSTALSLPFPRWRGLET